MLLRIFCPGHVDYMVKLTLKDAIDVAKSWVRHTNSNVYILKPLSGLNKNRFRHVLTVTPRDV